MATLAELLAAKKAPALPVATTPVHPKLYVELYTKLLILEGSWEDHTDQMRLLAMWLGPAEFPVDAPTIALPHWTQINWQVYRLASMLLPKEATHKETEQAALYLWSLYNR